jgi:hypothetical protein
VGPPVTNCPLNSVQVFRSENFWVQVWTTREAGRTESATSAARRATQVSVWDCMHGKVDSFIRFRYAVKYGEYWGFVMGGKMWEMTGEDGDGRGWVGIC